MKIPSVCVLVVLTACLASARDQRILPTQDADLISRYGLALEAIFSAGIRLQAYMGDDHGENFLISPVSATAVVGQLMLGARGQFRRQLYQLLSLPTNHHENDVLNHYGKDKNYTRPLPYSTFHLQLHSLLKALEGSSSVARQFVLKQRSALFVNDRVQLRPQFERNLRDFYSTDLYSMDFVGDPLGSQKSINEWASKHTNGLINTIASNPPSATTASVFANAIYFLGEWNTPFSDILNREGFFNVTATRQVPVTYMMGYIEDILYAESETYRLISLPYKNEELGMYMILPKPDNPHKYDLKTFGQKLQSKEILATIAKAKRRNVTVKMPKMSLSTSISILKQLKKYRAFKEQEAKITFDNRMDVLDTLEGRIDAFKNFTATAEKDIYLTNAAFNGGLKIDDIVQQVVFSVNEKGTEAAAVAASTIDYMGGDKTFVVDRPFSFFIRHEATAATLFWGTIGNPAA